MAGDDARDALERRVAALEKMLGVPPPTPMTRCAHCGETVPAGRFCAVCGRSFTTPASATPPPSARPSAAPPMSALAPPPAPVASPVPERAEPSRPASVENMLGERWAPRIGAALVSLGIIFFLGLAIQRGWVGPLAQLAVAVLAAGALLAVGAWLTAQRGYGTYPQLLEATGASVLYVTAFLAHALPYYQRQTGLTPLGGGLLMATVAIGTVALALWRDARIMAGLGFALGFVTALLGGATLPALTLPYVAILGTGLAILAARKAWTIEGLLGSLATGGLLLWLSSATSADATVVAIVALAPALAFLSVAARPAALDPDAGATGAMLAVVTFLWAAILTAAATKSATSTGILLFAWSLAALAHAIFAARSNAHPLVVAVSGGGAVVLWLVAAPPAWSTWTNSELLVTATYGLAALALCGFTTLGLTERTRGIWTAALALVGAAALYALSWPEAIHPPWEASARVVGPWQAWLTLAIVAAPLALASTATDAPTTIRRTAFWMAAIFGVLWTFALFTAALPATVWLLVVVTALLAMSVRAADQDQVASASALAAALGVLALTAFKIAIIDFRVPRNQLDATPAAFEALVVSGSMLALYHFARARHLMREDVDRVASGALVAGSALILVNWIFVYGDPTWTTVSIGALGAAYLAAGLIQRPLILYRYTGFAALGLVILRIFTVELRGTDLAVRALVFAAMGAVLLGIGYVYARMQRREAAGEGKEE